jgi:LacI family transcriptional regulator
VVSQPTAELGREAVRLLLERIKDANGVTHTVILPTQLVIRESCGSLLRSNGRDVGN